MPHYSKQTRLVKKTYYVTASALLNGGSFAPPPGGRPEFQLPSGSWMLASRDKPKSVSIDVSDYGKLLDVRVWVEFIHDNRLAFDINDATTVRLDSRTGLGTLAMTLRSPNVRGFGSGHPTWNDPRFRATYLTRGRSPSSSSYSDTEIYRDAFVLWDGSNGAGEVGVGSFLEDDGLMTAFAVPSASYVNEHVYNTWDNELDMRTVFSDGSRLSNPRDMSILFPSATEEDPGPATSSFQVTNPDTSELMQYGAFQITSSMPWTKVFASDAYPPLWHRSGIMFNGRRVPWFYDTRNLPASITGTTNFTGALGLSPPAGWLTGPGGTNTSDEFPTTGTQLGPNDIRPMYPLLDDVLVRQTYIERNENFFNEALGSADTIHFDYRDVKFTGFRPGLRGTEINGTWHLMFGMNSGSSVIAGLDNLVTGSGIWFRQARLELLVDQGEGPNLFNPASNRRYKKPGYVPALEGRRRVHILSGTSFYEGGIDYVYTMQRPEYGRTVGITDNTASSGDSFSVFSRITGSIETAGLDFDQLENIRSHFLKNEFGTPFIPLSSGSGVRPSFNPVTPRDVSFSRETFQKILRKDVPSRGGLSIGSTLSRTSFFRTVSDQMVDHIENAVASGSA